MMSSGALWGLNNRTLWRRIVHCSSYWEKCSCLLRVNNSWTENSSSQNHYGQSAAPLAILSRRISVAIKVEVHHSGYQKPTLPILIIRHCVDTRVDDSFAVALAHYNLSGLKVTVIWNFSLHPEGPFETEQGVVSSAGAPHSLLHVWIVAYGRAFTRWSFSSCLRGSLYAPVALTHYRSDPDSYHELWAFVVVAEYV